MPLTCRFSKAMVRRGCASVALPMLLGACSSAPVLEERAAEPGLLQRFDARALLAVADVDMAGTAYADGVLHPVPGGADTLLVLTDVGPEPVGVHVAASNAVMGWPGAIDVAPDGRVAYIVETRAPAPPGAEAFADGVFEGMPEGRRLTVVDLADPAQPEVVAQIDVGTEPTAVHVAPSGRFALVARKDPQDALAAVALDNRGRPIDVRGLGFSTTDLDARPVDQGAQFVRLSPDGRVAAVNVGNTHVQFLGLETDAAGLPRRAVPIGAPIAVGEWISVLRWSADGRHLLAADTGWGPGRLAAVLNGPGAIVSVAFSADGDHRIIDRETVSLSPEGFDVSPAGDLLAVVNMERTYLPERWPYRLFGRRAQASLSLIAFDGASGALEALDGPVAFAGVLPEDVVFDRDGDMLAVAIFHDRDPDTGAPGDQGWIELFALDGGARTRIVPTGARIPTTRGAHDLVTIP